MESLIPSKSKKSTENIIYDDKEKTSFLTRIFKRFYTRTTKYDDDLETLPADIVDEVEELEEDIETIDEVVEELEEVREGLLRRFFKRLFGIRSYDNFEEEDMDPALVSEQISTSASILKEDTRHVLKSIHKWLSKLSPEHIDSFRRSPDFIKYKEILEEYDLIKKD